MCLEVMDVSVLWRSARPPPQRCAEYSGGGGLLDIEKEKSSSGEPRADETDVNKD